MTDDAPALEEHFESLGQQRFAARFGMWVFLATEVMFFSGLFTGYLMYRAAHPEAFAAALRETDVLLGTINTALLLTSGLFVAIAVASVADRSLRLCRTALWVAVALGIAFLSVKGFEYHKDVAEGLLPSGAASSLPAGPERVFFAFYWAMTGIHVLHLAVGIGVFLHMLHLLSVAPDLMRRTDRLAVAGLYWGFVDIVWLFLYPVLYLIGRSG